MSLQTACLRYGSSAYNVQPSETLPLPVEFDFNNPVECARTILAIMSNASGGHRLRDCKLAVNPVRKTANITASGAHVYYAPNDTSVASLAKRTKGDADAIIAAILKDRVVHELGDVVTDQYGEGWKRARWTNTEATC